MQLVLHRDSYIQKMTVFEGEHRSKIDDLKSKSGWKTLLQVADIETLPHNSTLEERIAEAKQIADADGCAEREHPTRNGVMQY